MNFLSSADIFQNKLFSKKSFRNKIKVLNCLDPDQAQHSFGPDLAPNRGICYQMTKVTASTVKVGHPGLLAMV